MSATEPAMSVVIPACRRIDGLRRCLAALAAQGPGTSGLEVVVSIDGEEPRPAEVRSAAPPGLDLVVVQAPRTGPAGARNRGAAAATGRLLAFVDDDCEPEPGWAAALGAALDRDSTALVGGPIVNAYPRDSCAADLPRDREPGSAARELRRARRPRRALPDRRGRGPRSVRPRRGAWNDRRLRGRCRRSPSPTVRARASLAAVRGVRPRGPPPGPSPGGRRTCPCARRTRVPARPRTHDAADRAHGALTVGDRLGRCHATRHRVGLRDYLALARRLLEVVGVDLDEVLPLVGQLVLGEAGVHRAGLDARVAVDALLGIDVELRDPVIVGLFRRGVDAVDGTHLDARVVLGVDAGFGYDVGHGLLRRSDVLPTARERGLYRQPARSRADECMSLERSSPRL